MITTIILALNAGSVFLLSFIIFLNPGNTNKLANRWLGISLFGFGFALLADVIQLLSLAEPLSGLIVFSEVIRFIIAPALYLSVSSFTSAGRKFRKRDLGHFIPFLLFVINCVPLVFSGPLLLNRMVAAFPASFPVVTVFMSLVIKVQIAVYWIGAYVKLARHRKNIRLILSSPDTADLRWLKYVLLGILLIILLWFNEIFFPLAWINDITSWGYLAATYVVSYFALWQREVYPFPAEAVAIDEIIREDQSSKKQERIPASKIEPLKARLTQLMETEKYFLDPALGLPQLSERMNLSPHELSYLLNTGFGATFFEFVNRYRVEEAKRLLLGDQYQHLSMVGIAYESGFNSKTTFNMTFKKITGLSPTEFRKAPGNGGDLLPQGSSSV